MKGMWAEPAELHLPLNLQNFTSLCRKNFNFLFQDEVYVGWISLDLGALHQICPCLLLCGPYIKLPPQKSMRSLHKIGLIWCATQAWALSLPFMRKESSRHQKRNFLFQKFLECCFFVGEKDLICRNLSEEDGRKKHVKNLLIMCIHMGVHICEYTNVCMHICMCIYVIPSGLP